MKLTKSVFGRAVLTLTAAVALIVVSHQVAAQSPQVVIVYGADFSWCSEYAPGTLIFAFGNFAGVPSSVVAQSSQSRHKRLAHQIGETPDFIGIAEAGACQCLWALTG